MSSSWVKKLSVNDSDAEAILVHIASKSSDSNALDLDLLATDGEAAFRGKVRQRSLSKIRASNYDGSDAEWASILKFVLVSKQDSSLENDLKSNLEVSCSINGKSGKQTLTISFRTRIEDITQRLGTIELPESSNTDDVDLFGWTSQAIGERDKLEEDIVAKEETSGTTEEQTTSLKLQLEDLVKAKAQHENELISKFTTLLNDKKTKIRKLQRIISTARVDPKKLEQLEAELPARTKDGGQRGKKRTAETRQRDNESDESDGFEPNPAATAKEIDQDEPDDDDTQSQGTTTASEIDSDVEMGLPVTSQTERSSSGPSNHPGQTRDNDPLPAPRELPFTHQSQSQQQHRPSESVQKPQEVDEDTASEEDEL